MGAARQLRAARRGVRRRRGALPARSARASACALDVLRPGAPAGNVQAWARERALRGGRAARRGARRADRDRPHRDRPGRDRALPARRLAGAPRAAGDAGALRPDRPPAAGHDPRARPRRTAARAACRGARTRRNATSARGRIRADDPAGAARAAPGGRANVLRDAGAAARRGRGARRRGRRRARRGRTPSSGAATRGVRTPCVDARLRARRAGSAGHRSGSPADAGAARLAAHADAILALAARGGTARARPARRAARRVRVRAGADRARRARPSAPAPAALPVPGRVAYGGGRARLRARARSPIADGTLAAGALAATLEVRPWRPGDRMRPLGLGGSKSLQDLFTDRKVPRERRLAAARGGVRRRDRVGARRGHGRALPCRARTTAAPSAAAWRLDSAAP